MLLLSILLLLLIQTLLMLLIRYLLLLLIAVQVFSAIAGKDTEMESSIGASTNPINCYNLIHTYLHIIYVYVYIGLYILDLHTT